MIKMRFAVQDGGFPPIREVVELDPDEDGVPVPGEEGLWRVVSIANSIADMTGVYTQPVVNEFGDLIDPGGHLVDPPLDYYALPLREGLLEVDKDLYLAELQEHNNKYPVGGLGI